MSNRHLHDDVNACIITAKKANVVVHERFHLVHHALITV